jgi:hypothetical protein
MIEQRNETRLITETSVRQHFQQSVTTALANQRIDAEADTTCYVVNLLTSYLHTEQFFDRGEDGLQLRPLALMYKEAVEGASTEQRNRALRRLGDVALFVSGVFSDSLNRRLVDIDYYIAMGGNAYSYLSDNLSRSVQGQALRQVFTELAEKFTDFVDVLNEVSEQANWRRSGDVLRLYEVWLRTGSRRSAERLRALGIEPTTASSPAVSH